MTAARARQDLLAAVAHDLRNLLHTILLSVALVRQDERAREAAATRPMDRIRRTAEYMERLVSDLVESERIDAQRLLVAREPLALAVLMDEVVEIMAPLAAAKAIRLEKVLAVADAGMVIWIDRWRMTRVLTNLIGNAIKFTAEGGNIVVRAETQGTEAVVSVRDTGPGIPADDVAHLFDRFWQARQTAHLGTGLGLFIAKGIVEAHAGRIWVESAIGVGSTFFVAIPSSPPDARQEGPPAPPPSGGA